MIGWYPASSLTTIETKRWCREKGIFCEYATEYGWCKVTACMHSTILGGDTE